MSHKDEGGEVGSTAKPASISETQPPTRSTVPTPQSQLAHATSTDFQTTDTHANSPPDRTVQLLTPKHNPTHKNIRPPRRGSTMQPRPGRRRPPEPRGQVPDRQGPQPPPSPQTHSEPGQPGAPPRGPSSPYRISPETRQCQFSPNARLANAIHHACRPERRSAPRDPRARPWRN